MNIITRVLDVNLRRPRQRGFTVIPY